MSTRRSFLTGLGAAGGVLGLPGLARAIQDTTSPYRRPKLKITDVRTAQVLAHGHQVHVRIYTDQGLIGQGEATDAAVGTPPLIQGPLKRMLVGQDPLNVDNLFNKQYYASSYSQVWVAPGTERTITLNARYKF